MSRGKNWTDREIEILTAVYPSRGPAGVFAALTAEGYQRSLAGIVSAAYQHHLTGGRARYTGSGVDRQRAPRAALATNTLVRAIDGVRLSAMKLADDLNWTLARMDKLLVELDRRMEGKTVEDVRSEK